MTDEALKACPCCGEAPIPVVQVVAGDVKSGVWAVCCRLDCGLRGPRRYTEAEAIKAWNHRVAQRPTGDRES